MTKKSKARKQRRQQQPQDVPDPTSSSDPTPAESQEQVEEALQQQVRFEQQILLTPTPQQLHNSNLFLIPYQFFWIEEALCVKSSLKPSLETDSGSFQSALRLLIGKLKKIAPESTADLSATSISFRCIQLPPDPRLNYLRSRSWRNNQTGTLNDDHDDGWRKRFEERFERQDRIIAGLQKENADLLTRIAELEKDNAELRKDNAELRKDNAELRKDNEDIRKNIQEMQINLRKLTSDSDKVQRRALLDMARTKLVTLLGSVDLTSLTNDELLRVQGDSGVPITQAAISLVSTGRLRSDGNAAAHPAEVNAIRAATLRASGETLRANLFLLFEYVFGFDPNEAPL
ncbi:hypothetical protein HK405_014374 [Cladochytrium tenue]|nr:hypothetical protein HK405_014374 [Cladochytrium tenue]